MRKFAFAVAAGLISLAPAAQAQNHGEAGVFGSYYRQQSTKSNFAGLGARVGFGARHVQLEAEMSYDFTQAFTEGFRNNTTGTVTFTRSNFRVLDGLIGPKVQFGGPVKVFATLKGGVVNFRFDPAPATFATFTSTVSSLRTDNVRGVVYPGVGAEAFLGPIGFRLDVGDEIYFLNGAHNGLRVTFGPAIRF